MLNPDRALPNALEFKQLYLFLPQHLYLSQQLPKPDRALPNALVLEQSVISPSQTSVFQQMLNPDRALTSKCTGIQATEFISSSTPLFISTAAQTR